MLGKCSRFNLPKSLSCCVFQKCYNITMKYIVIRWKLSYVGRIVTKTKINTESNRRLSGRTTAQRLEYDPREERGISVKSDALSLVFVGVHIK